MTSGIPPYRSDGVRHIHGMRMDDVLEEIEQALVARGISARRASIEAVGNASLVKRMRSGEVPTVERLAALCDVLDLDFHVGRRRDPAPVDEDRLQLAVKTAVGALEACGHSLGHGEAARLVVAIYGLIGQEGVANAARVRELVRVLIERK